VQLLFGSFEHHFVQFQILLRVLQGLLGGIDLIMSTLQLLLSLL
jgi:hypothetical protein